MKTTYSIINSKNKMLTVKYKKNILLFFLCLYSLTNNAQLIMPSYFSDNMVLQQKTKVPFFGSANPNKVIEIKTSWNSKKYKTNSDSNGKWNINIDTPVYGGPYNITIISDEILVLNNVLIGEVWLCSGQSNMEMPLGGWGKVENYKKEIVNAEYPKIRLLQVKHTQSEVPLQASKLSANWQVCSSTTISEFSATAYFFARKVWKETGIPIGLIHSSWGGTVIEAWISKQSLETMDEFQLELASLTSKSAKDALINQKTLKDSQWLKTLDAKDSEKSSSWMNPLLNDSKWKDINLPAYWDNEVELLKDFDGVVWFRNNFELTENESENDIKVVYQADDNDKLWVNGTFVGETNGYSAISDYTILNHLLHPGKNQLTISVFDGGNQGGIYGKEFYLQTIDRVIPLSGMWKYQTSISLKELPKREFLYNAQNRPSVLFNAMIHPFLKFPITGVLWYQGESNAERAEQYRKLFPLMINDWREQFDNNTLPLYFVQLANYRKKTNEPSASNWAELRDAQLYTFKSVAHTHMIVTTDIGDSQDIHPKNKQEVGRRLALIALNKKYNKKNSYSGPIYKSYKIKNDKIEISFEKNEGNKLIAMENKKLEGFTIAGEDKHFYWANAMIKKGKVVVFCPDVKKPIAVRYNWSDNPQGNLYNNANLPASPFRTDNWK